MCRETLQSGSRAMADTRGSPTFRLERLEAGRHAYWCTAESNCVVFALDSVVASSRRDNPLPFRRSAQHHDNVIGNVAKCQCPASVTAFRSRAPTGGTAWGVSQAARRRRGRRAWRAGQSGGGSLPKLSLLSYTAAGPVIATHGPRGLGPPARSDITVPLFPEAWRTARSESPGAGPQQARSPASALSSRHAVRSPTSSGSGRQAKLARRG
jgi:hypothetical protein